MIRRLGFTQHQSGRFVEEKNSIFWAGDRTPDRPARSLITISTKLSWSLGILEVWCALHVNCWACRNQSRIWGQFLVQTFQHHPNKHLWVVLELTHTGGKSQNQILRIFVRTMYKSGRNGYECPGIRLGVLVYDVSGGRGLQVEVVGESQEKLEKELNLHSCEVGRKQWNHQSSASVPSVTVNLVLRCSLAGSPASECLQSRWVSTLHSLHAACYV